MAGYRKWQSLNRFVRKGEKGIAILAPLKYRRKIEREEGEEETLTSLRGFRVVHVFDIGQTDGEPLDDLDAVRPKLLDGDAPEGIWDALVAQANAAGFEVVRECRGTENGYCDFLHRKVAVRPGVSPGQALKTLIYELAHAMLHSEGPVPSREVAEVEVESVAFVVCDAIGLDTGEYSFAYVARWSNGEAETIKGTAERVIECAKRILCALEASRPPAPVTSGSRGPAPS